MQEMLILYKLTIFDKKIYYEKPLPPDYYYFTIYNIM